MCDGHVLWAFSWKYRSIAGVIRFDKMTPGLLHGGLEAKDAHVDVWNRCVPALVVQLLAALSNPRRSLVELRGRRLPLVLRFRAAVGGEIVGGEGSMSEEACSYSYPAQRGPKTNRVHW
jgi:hypothetical protein